MVHGPVFANEDSALEDFNHLHGDIQRDWDEIAIQNEARNKGVHKDHARLAGVRV